jgi:aminoglycoside phosphotransferase family enzyme/predicted kinase
MSGNPSLPNPSAVRRWQQIADALATGEVSGAESGAVFQTHISYVVVGPQHVYKLKKPIELPFVDYSTPQRRREMCVREFELNRRLAPSLYIAAKGLRLENDTFALCDIDDPDAVEFLVVMHHIDTSRMLDSRVDRLLAQPKDLETLGRVLARFHAEATPAPGGSSEHWQNWTANLTRTLRAADDILNEDLITAACDFLELWVDVNEPLLRKRVADGYIRDGHGDLRLEHVVFGENGVEVFDCVEFDDALRRIDVLADLSFLVMELQYADREDLSRALLAAWESDGGPLSNELLWAYATTRALIRVQVGIARITQLSAVGPSLKLQVAEELTQTLLKLAIRLSWRARQPRVIVLAGLSGSGKSSISRVLAERWGLERVSSDETRKRLVGVARDDTAPSHAYEDTVSQAVYERLGREAGREVTGGRSVIVDATFRRSTDAQAFVRALRSAGALTSTVTLACTAPLETLRERVQARSERGGSDASIDILETQLASQLETLVGISGAITFSTHGTFLEALRRAERLVLDQTLTPDSDGNH